MNNAAKVLLILCTIVFSFVSAQEAVRDGVGEPVPHSSHDAAPRRGWTQQPNIRGTVDIVWNCAITLFLCCWSVVCVNVPGPSQTNFGKVRQKLWLTLLSAFAPEVFLIISISQWLSAKKSIGLFHDMGCKDWTMNHGFYVNMGGLILKPRTRLPYPDHRWKSFPIDSEQLHYLVSNNFAKYPVIDRALIKDKNKVDGMLRILTLGQTLWFVVNVIGRAAQGLALTALELSTSAFIFCAMFTSFFWLHKPADVATPETIETNATIEDILLHAGDAASRVYNRTPLEFVNRDEWWWSILWEHGLSILRRMNLASPPAARPVDRFQTTIAPPVRSSVWFCGEAVTIVYLAIFIAGWNFSFPTPLEQTLWRTATVTALVGAMGMNWPLRASFRWEPRLRKLLRERRRSQRPDDPENDATPDAGAFRSKTLAGRAWHASAKLRNNSILKDPALEAPLAAVIFGWFFGLTYLTARAYVWVADVIELRSLPASAYETVDWWQFIPHFH